MNIRNILLGAATVIIAPHFAFAATDTVTCNGSDVTAQVAADALLAGETINFTAGTCGITNGVVIVQANNVTFNGAVSNSGGPATLIKTNGGQANGDIFHVGTSQTNYFTGTTFQNMILDCGAVPTDYYSGSDRGIMAQTNSNNTLVNNVVVQHCMTGIYFSASYSTIENSTSQYNNLNGLFFQGIDPGGVETAADHDTVMNNRVIYNNQQVGQVGNTGVTWDGIDFGSWTSNITVLNNVVFGPDILYHCDHPPSTNTGGLIQGNVVYASSKFGISVSGCTQNVLVQGNVVVGASQYGIVVNGSAGNGFPSGVTVQYNFTMGGASNWFQPSTNTNAVGNLQY